LHVKVEHAIGSALRPMSDAGLERKFHGLVDPVLGAAAAARIIAACGNLPRSASVRELTALACTIG
jgi:hypothetical protein